MRACKFKESNFILQPPTGENEDTCVPAYGFRGEHEILTCWEPDAADLERLNAGGKIWMWVRGGEQPPISLETEYPFEEAQEKSE